MNPQQVTTVVPRLIGLWLFYAVVMYFAVSLVGVQGFGVPVSLSLLALAVLLFARIWRRITIGQVLPGWTTIGSGVWMGLGSGLLLLLVAGQLIVAGNSFQGVAVFGVVVFGVAFLFLYWRYRAIRSLGTGWLALASGAWLGALLGIGIFLLAAYFLSPRGSFT